MVAQRLRQARSIVTRMPQLASVSAVVARGEFSRYAPDGRPSVTDSFESDVEQRFDVPHALGVSSGTGALMTALVGVGVGPGDEVLVPAYTWVSSAAAVLALGAVPVLVDIDESLTIDPIDVKAKITERTKAVMPVHMLNLVCDMDALTALGREHGIAVVEDACQAFGLRYKGRFTGTIGQAGAYSFSRTKNITSGEGGMVVTADERVAVRAAMYADVGSYTRLTWRATSEPLFVGINLKMSDLAASVLRPQLRGLDARLTRLATRRRIMAEELAANPDLTVTAHHDPAHAVGLTLTFPDAGAAEAFARATGTGRLIDSGRHVHRNWDSVLGHRAFSENFTPYRWAGVDQSVLTAETCSHTIDVLNRTCVVGVREDLPEWATRKVARSLAGHRPPPSGLSLLDPRQLRRP